MQAYEYWYLIQKEQKRELNPEEEKILQEWVRTNPENQKSYEASQMIWKASQLEPPKVDVAHRWQMMQKLIHQKKARRKQIYLGVAASVLLIGFLGWFVLLMPKKTVLTSQAQEIRQITLPDGSQVWLNENSQLSYAPHFNQKDRVIYLKGEAFFEVKKDQSKTFTIHSQGADIQVLGTSFLVSARDQKKPVNVILTSGKLSFKVSGLNPVILSPGEQAIFNPNTQRISLNQDFDANLLAWKTKELKFRNQSLRQVFRQLEDYYAIRIDLSKVSSLECPYSGTFREYSFKQVKDVIEATLNVTIEKIGEQRYQLQGAPCEN